MQGFGQEMIGDWQEMRRPAREDSRKKAAVSLLQMGEEQVDKGAETEYAESNHLDFGENSG